MSIPVCLHKTMIVHPGDDFGAQIDQAVNDALGLLSTSWAENHPDDKMDRDVFVRLVSYQITTLAAGSERYPPVMVLIVADVDDTRK